MPRQKPDHKHLRTCQDRSLITSIYEVSHHHGICQDKNLITSTCELSPPRGLPRQKPYHKHLRIITTTGFAKTKTLPKVATNFHHHRFWQDKSLTTSACERVPLPLRALRRQKTYHKHCELSHHGVCQDKNLTTSTCQLSPSRVLPRQKPNQKSLGIITTTGFAKTKTLSQALANYPHHGFCQDKNLATSTYESSPPWDLPRQKPFHKHLRTITTTDFAKTKICPQAPTNYHHYGFCQDKRPYQNSSELWQPRSVPRQKSDHKHLRICQDRNLITSTYDLSHHHGICQDKNLVTSTYELSPPRVLPRQKPYHKHLRIITTTGFAKTKTLPKVATNFHHHRFWQDKSLIISACECVPLPLRALRRQKIYHKHCELSHHGVCQDKNLTTSTCELSPSRILPRQILIKNP